MPLYATIHPRLYHKECKQRAYISRMTKTLFCKKCYTYLTEDDVYSIPGEKKRGR